MLTATGLPALSVQVRVYVVVVVIPEIVCVFVPLVAASDPLHPPDAVHDERFVAFHGLVEEFIGDQLSVTDPPELTKY